MHYFLYIFFYIIVSLITCLNVNAQTLPEGTNGDWIHIHQMSQPDVLNPLTSLDPSEPTINSYVYESLMEINRIDYSQNTLIANSNPEINKDNLNYIIKLNENVTFSDGEKLTGEDIIFTIKAILNPFIEFSGLRSQTQNLINVELVNDNKYIIKVTFSVPHFKNIINFTNIPILPKHLLDPEDVNYKITWNELASATQNPDKIKYSAMYSFATFLESDEVSTSPAYLVGSGPYAYDSIRSNFSISLKRNENYWNKQNKPAYPEKLIFKTISDQNEALESIKNGTLDFMFVIQPSIFSYEFDYPQKFNLKKILVREPTYSYIGWNNTNSLFSDKNVRLALSYAINRQEIINETNFGIGELVQSPVFLKNSGFNTELVQIPYEPNKAIKLLSDAGWRDSDKDGIIDKIIDGVKIDFAFVISINKNPRRKQFVLEIIKSLRIIGVKADYREYEWSVFLDKVKNHEFDAFYSAWQINVADDDPYLIWHSSQSSDEGSNYINYNNSESDILLEKLRIEFDVNKRNDIIKKWQEIIYDDQPVTFLWSEPARYLYSDRFMNANFYEFPDYPLFNEWWVPSEKQKYR